MTMKAHLLSALLALALSCSNAWAKDNRIDFARYKKQVKPIVQAMTLDEKLGQMTLAKFTAIQSNQGTIDYTRIAKYHLGALLAAGGEVPTGKGGVIAATYDPKDYLQATQLNWRQLIKPVLANPITVATKKYGKVKIPLLIGVDAMHGAQNVLGNTLFPQNIGLGMTHDPALVHAIGLWTARDCLASGFNWAYAPTVAISHNPDWGRTYESFGSDPTLVKQYASALVGGLQENDTTAHTINGVLASTKHYMGDGATHDGVDEGNVLVKDNKRFLDVNMSGYLGAIEANIGNIMVSYSAINGQAMSIDKKLQTTFLRKKKSFGGFLVSDYGAVDKVANQGLPTTDKKYPYPEALAMSINSGMDMVMLSTVTNSYKTIDDFLAILKADVVNKKIPLERIDDAVTNILATKYAMGLLRLNGTNATDRNLFLYKRKFTDKAEINTAIRAAEESFVLLKNDPQTLPLKKDKIKYIVLVGESRINVLNDKGTRNKTLYLNYDNIGVQNGGWTVSWQGLEGNDFWQSQNRTMSGATSLVDGLKAMAPNATLVYPHYRSATSPVLINDDRAKFIQTLATTYTDISAENTVIIGTLAEPPYAEFMGDVASPYCINEKDSTKGCLYNQHLNPYLPLQQRVSLAIDYAPFAKSVIKKIREKDKAIPMITVLFSGRPMIINQAEGALDNSSAFIAAWLPGTSGGQALANTLFGDYLFCHGRTKKGSALCKAGSANTLSMQWVQSMTSLQNYPIYTKGKGFVAYKNPLYRIGYGLATK